MRLRWLAALAMAMSFVPSLAFANDCPAGSKMKSEEGFSWCEPSVCLNDANCSPSEVCRPVPLCVEVGKLDERNSTKDAAQRLVATQRCAPDETCPSTQTCSKMSRCVTKAEADRMGMATAPGASASSAPAGTETKKSSCGCLVVGTRAGDSAALVGLALAVTAIGSRRIHRARRAPSRTR